MGPSVRAVVSHHPTNLSGRYATGKHVAVWVDQPAFDGTQHCAYADVNQFYPETHTESGELIPSYVRQWQYKDTLLAYCDGCPFQRECGEYAIAHEPDGMWGGLTPGKRKTIRSKRGQLFINLDEVEQVFSPENIEAYGLQHDTEEMFREGW